MVSLACELVYPIFPLGVGGARGGALGVGGARGGEGREVTWSVQMHALLASEWQLLVFEMLNSHIVCFTLFIKAKFISGLISLAT